MSGIPFAVDRRLCAAGVMLLALALFGLATKAKTSRYTSEPKSSTHFSTSVKVTHDAQPLQIFMAAPPKASPAFPPATYAGAECAVLLSEMVATAEPFAGLQPLRAPPPLSVLLL